jgi:hypothetical protein
MSEQAAEYQPQEPESLVAARKTRDSIIAKLDRLQALHCECSEIIEGSAHVVREAVRAWVDGADVDSPRHTAGHQLSAKRAAEAVLKEIGAIRTDLNEELRDAVSAFERCVRAHDEATRGMDEMEQLAVLVQGLKAREGYSAEVIARILDTNVERVRRALNLNVNRWMEV